MFVEKVLPRMYGCLTVLSPALPDKEFPKTLLLGVVLIQCLLIGELRNGQAGLGLANLCSETVAIGSRQRLPLLFKVHRTHLINESWGKIADFQD